MRYTIAILLLTASISLPTLATLGAAEPDDLFWRTNLKTAWTTAKSTRRPLLLYIQMPNCVFCLKMKRETFSDDGVYREIVSHFVPISIDRSDYPQLTQKLDVRLFPSTFVIEPDGRVAESVNGYLSAAEMKQQLQVWRRKRSEINRELGRFEASDRRRDDGLRENRHSGQLPQPAAAD